LERRRKRREKQERHEEREKAERERKRLEEQQAAKEIAEMLRNRLGPDDYNQLVELASNLNSNSWWELRRILNPPVTRLMTAA
jgi:hypothetical protein